MKKKYIIILLIILLASCLVFFSHKFIENKRKDEELEAIEIFEKNAVIKVSVRNSTEDINDIKRKLENIEYVKSVEFISKENELENMKNKISSDIIDYLDANMFENSFVIKLEVNSIQDFKKVKMIENNLEKIDGIYNVISSGCNEIIEVYEETGINGLREYDKILTIIMEQGSEAVNVYLEEHKETRELLKDFIHF